MRNRNLVHFRDAWWEKPYGCRMARYYHVFCHSHQYYYSFVYYYWNLSSLDSAERGSLIWNWEKRVPNKSPCNKLPYILKCSRTFDTQMLSDDEFDDGDEWDVLETIDSFDCDYNDCEYSYSRTRYFDERATESYIT